MIWELCYLQSMGDYEPYEQIRMFFGTKKKALAHKKYLIKTADNPNAFTGFVLTYLKYNKTKQGVADLCNYVSD